MVTKNEAGGSFLALPLQDYMFRSIQKHPTFFFSCHTTEEGREVFDRTLNYNWIQNSGDFESATDLFCPSWSKRIVERVCNRLCLSPLYTRAMVNLVGEVDLFNGLDPLSRTQVGQMMGNPLSFPLLCVINAAIYLTSIQISSREMIGLSLLDLPVLINGDDIVFSIPEASWVLDWINVVGKLGLKVSTSKTGVSREWFSLNSRVFTHASQKCQQIMAPLCPLLIGNRDRPTRLVIEDASIKVRPAVPQGKRVGEISDEVNYSVFGIRHHRSSLIRLALGYRGIDYESTPFCPFYTVKNGGLGIEPDLVTKPGGFGYKQFRVRGYDITQKQNSIAQMATSEMEPSFERAIRKIRSSEVEPHMRFIKACGRGTFNKSLMVLWKPLFGASSGVKDHLDYLQKLEMVYNLEAMKTGDYVGPMVISSVAKSIFFATCTTPTYRPRRQFSHRLEFYYDLIEDSDERRTKSSHTISLNDIRKTDRSWISTPFIDKKGRCSVHATSSSGSLLSLS